MKKIQSALISVFYKDGLEPLVRELAAQNITIYSTGGTQKFIEALGINCTAVEDVTSYPSILGGRVKTLHPKMFGGILYRRELEEDIEQIEKYEIPPIDLVIVDLYPFEETLASGADDAAIIEKIDVGGPSMIRAAAKNHKDVAVVANKDLYATLTQLLQTQNGSTTLEQRRDFAKQAFAVTAHYDKAISEYFAPKTALRYGENPHQKAEFKGDLEKVFTKLHGKEISYNNLLDINAALDLMGEFLVCEPTFAILKHNNACGVATRPTLVEAYEKALEGDPISAFGGVLIANREMDLETAQKVNTLFYEVVIAPGYENEALELLKSKKNRVLLVADLEANKAQQTSERTMLGGILSQQKDNLVGGIDGESKLATTATVDADTMAELIFANKIVKHSKSNAIVLSKNGMLLGSGVGQTSRVDALKHAIEKAHSFELDLNGAVMASDAFFPFADCVEIAHKAGITAVIQPGGSVRDGETVEYCNENGVAMIITGTRHFKH
ncbi:MAG: bifunctional phosphoribosylaminoimidazolecarboxamide formyltransferase/IMP cyclohydrolase [Rikenellaceae bacterium]